MTFFVNDGVTSCQIAGAVAEAALHDLRVNNFTFNGFPKIEVKDPIDSTFTVLISWGSKSEEFTLTRASAVSAAKKFNNNKGFERAIFERTQKAIAALEGAVNSVDAIET